MHPYKKLTHLIIALLVSFPGWIYIFIYDWKIAVALVGILWGNNITNRVNNN